MSGKFESKSSRLLMFQTSMARTKPFDTKLFWCTFSGELDERNWIFDFGGLKRTDLKIEGKIRLTISRYI